MALSSPTIRSSLVGLVPPLQQSGPRQRTKRLYQTHKQLTKVPEVVVSSDETPFRPAGVVALRLRLAPRLLRVGHRRGSLDLERDGRGVVVGAAGVPGLG